MAEREREKKTRDIAKAARNDDGDGESKKAEKKASGSMDKHENAERELREGKAQRRSKGNTSSYKQSANHVHTSATQQNTILSHYKKVSVVFISRALPMAQPAVSPKTLP